MKKKNIIILIIVLIIIIVASAILGNKKIDKPDDVITSVRELSIIEGYDDKSIAVVEDNYEYKIIISSSNNMFSIIDNSYNIIEANSKIPFKFMKTYRDALNNYYYTIDGTNITIKLKGAVKYNIDIVDYKKTDFNIVNIYEPIDNKIFMILFTDNKYTYLLYDDVKKDFKSFESDKLIQMVNLNDNNYFALLDNELVSLKTFEKLNVKYDNSSIISNKIDEKDLFGVTYSSKYIILNNNNESYLVDITKGGNRATKSTYKEIVDVTCNDKYFSAINNNKYSLYDVNEQLVIDSVEYIRILEKYIVTMDNKKFIIYDLDMKKIKEIDYDLNYEVNAYDFKDTITLVYRDKDNVIYSYAMYNAINDKIFMGDVKMLIRNNTLTGLYRKDKKVEFLFNNLNDIVTTDDKTIYESPVVNVLNISKDSKKYCITASNIVNINHYYTVLLEENKIYKVNHHDCMNFNKKPKFEYDLDSITLKNNGNITSKKIENIEQVNEKYFKVTYDDNVWLYEYVK